MLGDGGKGNQDGARSEPTAALPRQENTYQQQSQGASRPASAPAQQPMADDFDSDIPF